MWAFLKNHFLEYFHFNHGELFLSSKINSMNIYQKNLNSEKVKLREKAQAVLFYPSTTVTHCKYASAHSMNSLIYHPIHEATALLLLTVSPPFPHLTHSSTIQMQPQSLSNNNRGERRRRGKRSPRSFVVYQVRFVVGFSSLPREGNSCQHYCAFALKLW